MILISQDGFKAFNMAYIRSYQITEDTLAKTPQLSATDEKHEYIIWVDPNPESAIRSYYTIGRFKTLEDAQKVFNKLISINLDVKGKAVVTENGVDIFIKNNWTGEVEKC